MGRLTIKDICSFIEAHKRDCKRCYSRVCEYPKSSRCNCLQEKDIKAYEELKEYKELEEKGLLFKMPCKPGDVCYFPITDPNGADPSGIIERKVSKIILGKQHDQIVFTNKHSFTIWGKNWDEYFYKYVHFTREAAEQALQQIQEENKNEKN